jgi:hypothetical protein
MWFMGASHSAMIHPAVSGAQRIFGNVSNQNPAFSLLLVAMTAVWLIF